MGKIVKYCAACEESFAEKFGFCPNCGQAMVAFEMNPIMKESPTVEEAKADEMIAAPIVPTPAPETLETVPEIKIAPLSETFPAMETVSFSANQTQTFSNDFAKEKAEEVEAIDEPVEPKTFAAAAGANGNGDLNQTTQYNFQDVSDIKRAQPDDDDYHITVVEETNGKQRNLLLLASTALMLTLALGGTVYSLFNKSLMVGAINEESGLYVSVVEDVPVEVEEQPKPKIDKDAGGGGGGGREEQEKASDGRLVNQSEKPITPPNARVPQMTNPTIPIIMETQGNIKRPITEKPPGLPGSDNLNPSNGTGRGGGLGGGNGTGLGNGNGTGEGNGNGSGSGNGDGDGNGNGRGSGNQGNVPPPPPTKPVGVTTDVKIISKPTAKYTDLARQNQYSGTVRLRVTFLASGQIGSISPVTGSPFGLTEQAIAAARSIRFEPAKKDGVPIAKVKQIDYSFKLY